MVQKLISYILHNRKLISVICVIGILAVSYGMLNDNNLVFIIGLVFVIGGYLLIRRRIKDYIKKNLTRTHRNSLAQTWITND
jgi:LPXTG-motif cell wall-anchored protein